MKEGAVTLLDILGWKGIWQRRNDAIKSYQNILDITYDAIDQYLMRAAVSEGKKKRFSDLKPNIVSISDTIALVTHGPCDLTLEFHALLSIFIIIETLRVRLPMRGATCYGYFNVHDNIMIGPAIDEVASWYEMVEWIGIIQTPSAFYRTNTSNYLAKKLVINYPVPIKQHEKFNTNCANWVKAWLSDYNEEDLKNIFST